MLIYYIMKIYAYIHTHKVVSDIKSMILVLNVVFFNIKAKDLLISINMIILLIIIK